MIDSQPAMSSQVSMPQDENARPDFNLPERPVELSFRDDRDDVVAENIAEVLRVTEEEAEWMRQHEAEALQAQAQEIQEAQLRRRSLHGSGLSILLESPVRVANDLPSEHLRDETADSEQPCTSAGQSTVFLSLCTAT